MISPTAVSRSFLYCITFVTGAATMLAEIAAGRLVAPFYGTSTPVWALLIGAVLASLAVGQALGGRLARSDRFVASSSGLGSLLIGSAVLLAALPLVAPPVMSGSLTWLLSGSVGTLLASFVGITALLALPMVALGACGPLVMHLAQHVSHGDSRAGVVAGRIYSLGTTGSLVGTYLSGLVLVPLVGTRATLWIGAAALAALGIVAAVRGRWRAGALGLLTMVTLSAIVAPSRRTKSMATTVFETESRLQYIQVTEERGLRSLYLNDGYAVQSILPLDGSLRLRGVWGYYALSPAWTALPRPHRILLLGLGGGTSARTLRHLLPEAHITGVEIDPAVIDVGRRFFELPADIRVIADDARAALRKPPLSSEPAAYDIIILDAFQFPYVPFQLCSVEMFRQLDQRLAPGGAVVINLGRDHEAREVVHAVARTLGTVMPVIRSVDVPSHPNTMVVGTRHDPSFDLGVQALPYPRDVILELAALPSLKPLNVPPDTPLFTDDRAPVEPLTDWIVLRRLLSVVRRGSWI